MDGKVGVASFTDAWIETPKVLKCIERFPSHLLQMRGLKRKKKVRLPLLILSHLLQMRGLKLLISELEKTKSCRIFYRCVD